jgi:peptidoglycan/LPS O-acetylase OafA/YrhL
MLLLVGFSLPRTLDALPSNNELVSRKGFIFNRFKRNAAPYIIYMFSLFLFTAPYIEVKNKAHKIKSNLMPVSSISLSSPELEIKCAIDIGGSA